MTKYFKRNCSLVKLVLLLTLLVVLPIAALVFDRITPLGPPLQAAR